MANHTGMLSQFDAGNVEFPVGSLGSAHLNPATDTTAEATNADTSMNQTPPDTSSERQIPR